MAHRLLRLTRRGRGSRGRSSLARVIIGLILFFVSFIALWLNEGRVDMSKIAIKSTPARATAVDPAHEGQFVSISGRMTTSERLGDEPYLKPGDYVQLTREVEMYAWVEKTKSDDSPTP